ncbi:related to integral membrane protein [Phialocephala subalpina]|uniref:Related to integral membrane protein n=1 Tax=Phialocephala subalpina TaxID=576137 RepID=A0A1L7WSB1_9HELO|nr:related to integral membrane protein [Phialocephala subalpina]
MGGIGAVAEPLVVIALLIGGTWINRDFEPGRRRRPHDVRRISGDGMARYRDVEEDAEPRSTSPSLLVTQEPKWRTRTLGAWGVRKEVTTPNTRQFKGYFLSRLLERFPFLVECWYWALIYWVYQLGRAATAVWIVEGTIFAARKHAIQVIAVEERIHIFWELPMQQFFMQNQFIMTWINRTYSFIHIPGSIAFLIWLFYYTNTRNHADEHQSDKSVGGVKGSPAGPRLYESRRRTMAFCNLLAFVIFTAWPCMPPRLLSADTSDDNAGKLARSYGFVDTVHGPGGEGSIWTDNRFTNKFAAMPSLHFGYSLLIGLTIATIPLNPAHPSTSSFMLPFFNQSHPSLAPKITLPSWRRMTCIAVGTFYPSLILLAIIATANHFLLDAVAGSMVCGVAWWGNDVLLNLLVMEDWFLWVVRIHKPERVVVEVDEEDFFGKGVLRH